MGAELGFSIDNEYMLDIMPFAVKSAWMAYFNMKYCNMRHAVHASDMHRIIALLQIY